MGEAGLQMGSGYGRTLLDGRYTIQLSVDPGINCGVQSAEADTDPGQRKHDRGERIHGLFRGPDDLRG